MAKEVPKEIFYSTFSRDTLSPQEAQFCDLLSEHSNVHTDLREVQQINSIELKEKFCKENRSYLDNQQKGELEAHLRVQRNDLKHPLFTSVGVTSVPLLLTLGTHSLPSNEGTKNKIFET